MSFSNCCAALPRDAADRYYWWSCRVFKPETTEAASVILLTTLLKCPIFNVLTRGGIHKGRVCNSLSAQKCFLHPSVAQALLWLYSEGLQRVLSLSVSSENGELLQSSFEVAAGKMRFESVASLAWESGIHEFLSFLPIVCTVFPLFRDVTFLSLVGCCEVFRAVSPGDLHKPGRTSHREKQDAFLKCCHAS